ncbi:hypothetical protein JTB14_019284 [Gonioctena quinquepunctata]|nr:hypothetical protein JTB14_019284 [Gonioctena quinquepunctata]
MVGFRKAGTGPVFTEADFLTSAVTDRPLQDQPYASPSMGRLLRPEEQPSTSSTTQSEEINRNLQKQKVGFGKEACTKSKKNKFNRNDWTRDSSIDDDDDDLVINDISSDDDGWIPEDDEELQPD